MDQAMPPDPQYAAAPQQAPGPIQPLMDLSSVRVPLLVSGIFNILLALAWISSCFLAFLAIPPIVLAIYEFIMYSKLGTEDPRSLAGRVRVIGILEICSILLGGLVQMICGILVVANVGKLEQPADG